MDDVQRLFQVTKKLYDLLETKDIDRDTVIEQLNILLDERADIMSLIAPPFTEVQEKMGKQMIIWNQAIKEHLEDQKFQIQEDIQGTKRKKDSVNKYVNPYQSLQRDGIFYDKRK